MQRIIAYAQRQLYPGLCFYKVTDMGRLSELDGSLSRVE